MSIFRWPNKVLKRARCRVLLLCTVGVVLPFNAFADTAVPPHREVVARFYDEIWNQGNEATAFDILSDTIRFRGSTGPYKTGIHEFLGYVRLIRTALADYHCTIEEVISDRDALFARMTFKGTHVAPFFGVVATGKIIEWSGAARFKIVDGKVVDLWVLGDVDSLKVQLGIARSIAP